MHSSNLRLQQFHEDRNTTMYMYGFSTMLTKYTIRYSNVSNIQERSRKITKWVMSRGNARGSGGCEGATK